VGEKRTKKKPKRQKAKYQPKMDDGREKRSYEGLSTQRADRKRPLGVEIGCERKKPGKWVGCVGWISRPFKLPASRAEGSLKRFQPFQGFRGKKTKPRVMPHKEDSSRKTNGFVLKPFKKAQNKASRPRGEAFRRASLIRRIGIKQKNHNP